MTTTRPFLSVIVPAYNEEKRVAPTIVAIESYLASTGREWELLIVDDGSIDSTIAVAEATFADRERSRVVRSPRNRGKGAAVRRGMLASRGRYRLFADADNSTPIAQVEKLLRAMRQRGCDVAIASRAMRESRLEVRQPMHREFMGRVFNLVVQTIALPGIVDTQCGFKLFSERAAKAIFPHQKLDGFSFDVEILMRARREGFMIVEVPVHWIDHASSRVSPLRDSFRVLRDTLWLRAAGFGSAKRRPSR